tara:strand:+ start:624 stop:1172 length:549 start_codon:yes stop_codon:yes gene_type:complete
MKNSTQIFLFIAVIFLSGIYFTTSLVQYENKIESLEEIIHQDSCLVDSLQHSIDSLNERYQIFDSQPARELIDIINAISYVESSGRDSAYNASEDAVGYLQIRQCMVKDVNRILKQKGSLERYVYEDRWLRYKSIQMFNIYCQHYKLSTAEEIARCWNGGPRGMQNEMTVGYWEKVSNKLNI